MEVCDHQRTIGNQAYGAGEFSKAERHYSIGIHEGRCSLLPLVLCYCNRAAARMSLFRMREAIEDCELAAALDPTFLKVKLRAAKCYLLLGEVEDAVQYYTEYLSSENGVSLDRRSTVHAVDGLQMAEEVIMKSRESAKLSKQGTETAATSALESIEDALSISCHSERLLEMKAEALSILHRHDQVIQLCEETLDVARLNFRGDDFEYWHLESWRWNMQIQSNYHMGRFDLALDMISKQEKIPNRNRAAASNIYEALSQRRSGNEAFRGGRYIEVIKHYTLAISACRDSELFLAICFCNRATAYKSLNQIIDAISDYNLAISLDENYQIAIFRRATLYQMIRFYEQAISGFKRSISLLESEPKSKMNLVDARHHLRSIQEKIKEETSPDFYLIVGVQDSDSKSDVKKAYKKAVFNYHPDKAKLRFMKHTGDDGRLWK